jgi:fido (protein-threonine AMPylation protein)
VVKAFQYPLGATPLDPDEAAGLIPTHITTQTELNEWEQTNILTGLRWALRQKRRDVLDEVFVRELHRHMLGHTWQWAGKFRQSDKNIGVD